MANTRTLTVLLADIREAAGVEGLTDRHPDATLIKWINLSWRLLRTKLVDAGMPGLTIPTTIAALGVAAPVSTETYQEITWPDGAVGIYGVDVLEGNEWLPLEPISFARRRDYAQAGTASRPEAWFPITLPTESTTTITAGKIALVPLSSGAKNYRVWYLPVWVDVVTGANVFYGHDIWFDWLIQDVVRRVSQKDNDSAETLAEAIRRQGEHWEDIKRSIQNMNLAQPIRRVRRDRMRGSRTGD